LIFCGGGKLINIGGVPKTGGIGATFMGLPPGGDMWVSV
jgi:hypothetical protein